MSAMSVEVPFPVFYDRSGEPLENGYVWIGQANLNPQTNPIQVYFDKNLTQPAAQPLRTLAGYISNAGTPAQIYVDANNFSILVQDKNGTMVYNFPDGTGIEPIPANACGVTYDPPFIGGVPYPVCEKLEQIVSVKDFGVVGDGVADDSVAFQSFVTQCSLEKIKGIVNCPINLNNTIITINSDTDIEFVLDGKLINGSLNGTGSIGSEVGLTSNSLRGQTTINVPGAGFSIGDLIYIKSCINCLSVDAGDDRLGVSVGNPSYFAEFAVIKNVTTNFIIIDTPLIFDYVTTPGPNSGARTNSTVAKVTPVKNIKISNAVMQDKASSIYQIFFELAKDVSISGSFNFTSKLGFQHCVGFQRSLNCVVTQAKVNRLENQGTTGSSQNSFFSLDSQNCGFSNLEVTSGGQAVDFTYSVDPLKSAANVNCFVENSYFWGAREAVTVHPGCYNTSISNCHAYGCETAFRIRSKATKLVTFSAVRYLGSLSATPIGIGVLISEGGYSEDTIVSSGTCIGHLFGVGIDLGRVTASPVAGRLLVSNLTISQCESGVYFYQQDPTNALRQVVISNVLAIGCLNQGILINPYNNGVVIDGFTAIGPYGSSARAGIEYRENLTNLTITNATFSGLGSVIGLRGPGVSSFITDTTTFPLGNAEGKLYFAGLNYVAQTLGSEFSGIIRDDSAYSTTLNDFNYGYKIGAAKVRQHQLQTTDIQEWQNSSGTKLLGVSINGKLSGSVASSVKTNIAAATDVPTLKTALAGLFE